MPPDDPTPDTRAESDAAVPLLPTSVPTPPPLPGPRLWTALLIGPLAIIAAIFLAGMVAAVAMIAFGGMPALLAGDSMQIVETLAGHPFGIVLLVLPGQLTFLGAAVAAAFLSPHPWRPRLGLVRPGLPWWTLLPLTLGTMFFGAAGSMIVETLFPGPHEHLEVFIKMAQMPRTGVFLVTVLLLSVLPGVTEEALFRGYIQSRLLQRWPAAAAIATSTAIFALGHADPIHILSVLPVGAWLGIVAWRCGSVWPGIICHAAMNAVSFSSMRFSDPRDHSITPMFLVFLGVSAIGVAGSLLIFRRHPKT